MFEPLPPEEQVEDQPETPVVTRTRALVAGVALFAVFGMAYTVHEHNVASAAQDQNAAMAASLKSTNAQLEQLTAKLNELSAKPAAAEQPSAEVSNEAASAPRHVERVAAPKHLAKASSHAKHHRADPSDARFKKLESKLDEQGKTIDQTRQDIASTRQDLSTAKTELSGSIARTHGELVVLQRKGERNFHEFDIQKAKVFSESGPLGIKLKKANVKNQYADLEMIVDDRKVSKKHINLYEPAMFYTGDSEQPIQVVINSITKDHIHGYVSEPKYRTADLTAMQNDSQTQQPVANDTTNGANSPAAMAVSTTRQHQRMPVH